MIFFRVGVIIRSVVKFEIIEVYFYVLVFKDFLKSVNDDWVMIIIYDDFFGRWINLRYRMDLKE